MSLERNRGRESNTKRVESLSPSQKLTLKKHNNKPFLIVMNEYRMNPVDDDGEEDDDDDASNDSDSGFSSSSCSNTSFSSNSDGSKSKKRPESARSVS